MAATGGHDRDEMSRKSGCSSAATELRSEPAPIPRTLFPAGSALHRLGFDWNSSSLASTATKAHGNQRREAAHDESPR